MGKTIYHWYLLIVRVMSIEYWGFVTTRDIITVISEDPWQMCLLQRVLKRSSSYLFRDLESLQWGFDHPTFCMRGERPPPRLQHIVHLNFDNKVSDWTYNIFLTKHLTYFTFKPAMWKSRKNLVISWCVSSICQVVFDNKHVLC